MTYDAAERWSQIMFHSVKKTYSEVKHFNGLEVKKQNNLKNKNITF